MLPRHRRTPSIPLKVRRVSFSQNPLSRIHDAPHDVAADELDTLLSPAAADLPPVLPSSLSRSKPSSTQNTQVDDDDDDGAQQPATPESEDGGNNASEKYGFLLYAASLVGWYLYLFWAFTPDRWIKAVGLEWYPSREWAILLPSWIMVTIVFVYLAYLSLNLYNTPPLDGLECMTDTQAHLLDWEKEHRRWQVFQAEQASLPAITAGKGADGQRALFPSNISVGSLGEEDEDYVPPLMDLPAGVINRCIFRD